MTRIPVGTQVVVTGKGLRGKKRKGTVVAPELVKGYNVQHADDGSVDRYPDKKVRVSSSALSLKQEIAAMLEPMQEEARRFTEAVTESLERTLPPSDDTPLRSRSIFVTSPSARNYGTCTKIIDGHELTTPIGFEEWIETSLHGFAGWTPVASRVGAMQQELRSQPKPLAPRRSKAYLSFVRKLDCCNCGTPGPSDPHHEGKRGVGQKTSDMLAIPLCRRCHSTYTDENQLPRCVDGKDKGRFDREESLRILHGAQVDLLTMVLERLVPGKRAEVLAAAVASLDDEMLARVLK